MDAILSEPLAGRYDPALRRRSVRRGRERGCWLYVPAAELEAAGYSHRAPVPYYRIWGGGRRGLVVQFYNSR